MLRASKNSVLILALWRAMQQEADQICTPEQVERLGGRILEQITQLDSSALPPLDS